jgi:hypothetical protein
LNISKDLVKENLFTAIQAFSNFPFKNSVNVHGFTLKAPNMIVGEDEFDTKILSQKVFTEQASTFSQSMFKSSNAWGLAKDAKVDEPLIDTSKERATYKFMNNQFLPIGMTLKNSKLSLKMQRSIKCNNIDVVYKLSTESVINHKTADSILHESGRMGSH